MATRSLSRGQIFALAISGGVAFVVVVAWVFSIIIGGVGVNPFVGASLYTNPESSAATAAASASGDEKTAFDRIAATPSAIWLTPEEHPTSEITSFVAGIVKSADAVGQLPVFVVYGLPDRDCSGLSSGGTTTDDYPNWTAAISDGLGKYTSVVILEPDSLSLTAQCGEVDARVAELGQAITALTNDHTNIYLDGGHSTWLAASAQADLLNQAGVGKVRGFASNVSNFNTTASEVSYDNEVSQLTGGAHYVIDIGRNGNGTNDDWCNPNGRALGAEPEAVDDGSAHDANLWIKNPGESDGTCNGGPDAGVWWAEAALALATN